MKEINAKQELLKEIREYFNHECIYNPSIIRERYGFKNAESIKDLVNRLNFKI